MKVEVYGVDVKEVTFRDTPEIFVSLDTNELDNIKEAVIKHEVRTSIGVVKRTLIMPKDEYAKLTLKHLESYILTEAGVIE